MAPSSNEDQFKFLISCIRYSNNGRVDFGEVARECGIVSKGAAAKRYERMMKAHGIATGTSPGKISGQSPTTKGESSKGSPTKKRKAAETLGPIGDDDEVKSELRDENIIKKENVFEHSNSGGSLFGWTEVNCEGGVSSSVGNPSEGEGLEHAETILSMAKGDGSHESIVID